MQQELQQSPQKSPQTNPAGPSTPPNAQHGSIDSSRTIHRGAQALAQDAALAITPRSAGGSGASANAIDTARLDEQLRRLSLGHETPPAHVGAQPGKRISDYESLLLSTPRSATPSALLPLSASVRSATSDNVQLTEFPNEVLTQILSHLPAEAHFAVALVSKRFYALITTPHAWRTAFHRFYPGTDDAATAMRLTEAGNSPQAQRLDGLTRSEPRSFNRLTAVASWRSEYLLRTRLLRSLARGKPGAMPGALGVPGTSSRQRTHSKKPGAVLTYYSKLPWMVTNLHAVFLNGKKPPRVIHGAAGLGIASASDPTSGKVEKWGLDDHFTLSQLDEVFPGLVPYGAAGGPVGVPNVADVSQQYGFIGGEGFPGGRLFFRSLNERGGRYLLAHGGSAEQMRELPKIPAQNEAICSVWIAKTNTVPSLTQATIGILAGSSLGVVTSYALGAEYSSVYSNGDITARWILSPGIPVVALRVDDFYTARRKAAGRVLAVALNALGEVFCLRSSPMPPAKRSKLPDLVKDAWIAGRTVDWELLTATRRRALHPEDRSAMADTSSSEMLLSPDTVTMTDHEQLCKHARNVEKHLSATPLDIKEQFGGWDMRRLLEVDFAGADDTGLAEGVFVISCGYEGNSPATVTRHSRITEHKREELEKGLASKATHSSPNLVSGSPASHIGTSPRNPEHSTGHEVKDEWQSTVFSMPGLNADLITASAADQGPFANLGWYDDPLGGGAAQHDDDAGPFIPFSKQRTGEIPGRRARLLAVGTDAGAVVVWNMRSSSASSVVYPLRVIQTQSPRISTLALSALYLVHGGSDGLAQAWDPLASTLEPIRTLNARSSGRLPRQIATAIPPSMHADYTAVGAIYLDPDPTVLRGVIAFGSLVRYWTYSSTGGHTGRKRRLRQSDMHGRLASRRQSGAVTSYIAAEEAEMRRDQDNQDRERARLQSRFGLGMGLTEDEAIRYAELMSEETYADEQRRLSASDTGSTPDIGDSISSSSSSMDAMSTLTMTPDPSMSGGAIGGPRTSLVPQISDDPADDEFEQQMQRALRLSLLESDSQSPPSSGDYDIEFRYKAKKGKVSPAAARSPIFGESSRTRTDKPVAAGRPGSTIFEASPWAHAGSDDDLELALRLSLQQASLLPSSQSQETSDVSVAAGGDDKGKGKQKEVV